MLFYYGLTPLEISSRFKKEFNTRNTFCSCAMTLVILCGFWPGDQRSQRPVKVLMSPDFLLPYAKRALIQGEAVKALRSRFRWVWAVWRRRYPAVRPVNLKIPHHPVHSHGNCGNSPKQLVITSWNCFNSFHSSAFRVPLYFPGKCSCKHVLTEPWAPPFLLPNLCTRSPLWLYQSLIIN